MIFLPNLDSYNRDILQSYTISFLACLCLLSPCGSALPPSPPPLPLSRARVQWLLPPSTCNLSLSSLFFSRYFCLSVSLTLFFYLFLFLSLDLSVSFLSCSLFLLYFTLSVYFLSLPLVQLSATHRQKEQWLKLE